jgi:hypothetical protein
VSDALEFVEVIEQRAAFRDPGLEFGVALGPLPRVPIGK